MPGEFTTENPSGAWAAAAVVRGVDGDRMLGGVTDSAAHPPALPLSLRSLDELGSDRWDDIFSIPRFVFAESPTSAVANAEASVLDDDGVLAVIEGDPATGAVVGTAARYDFGVSVPGGAVVPAGGITNVGVLPTHRRRGIMRSLMERLLDDIADTGAPLAVLDASETGIYGRFGFAIASRYASVRVAASRSAFGFEPPDRQLRLLRSDDPAAPGLLAGVWDAALGSRPGALTRSERWWAMLLGETEMWKGGGLHEVVVAHPDGDDPGGYALFRLRPTAEDLRLELRELVAATPETHAALWRFCLDVDLVGEVRAEVPVDDPLWWWLVDPRAVQTTGVRDFLFARVLDVPAVLAARRYQVPVELTMAVDDPMRPSGAAHGVFALTGGPDGAVCTRVDLDPGDAEVALGVGALSGLVLGGMDARVLATTGAATARRPGALGDLALAMAWTPAPFCATRF